MNALTVVKGIGRILSNPLGILEEWAVEPLRRFEFERDQIAKDNDLQRQIEVLTAQKRFETEMEIKLSNQRVDLEIKMQTEISRINVQLQEWQKDEQFNRMIKVTEAVMTYQEKLTDLNICAIRKIGNMDIELREKAQDLILRKTYQYKELQDRAQRDAEDEFERILTKFASNQRVLDIMVNAAESKLVSVIDNSVKFLEELNVDIQMMNKNIDRLTSEGQSFIKDQLRQFRLNSPNDINIIEN